MAKPKYAHLIDNLPRLLGAEPAYQVKVDAVKQALRDDINFVMHAAFLAKEYVNVRMEKENVEDELSEINLRLEAVSQLMAEQFEVEGVSSLKTDSGRTISVYAEPYPQVHDKELYRQWCLSKGFERDMHLWPSKTAALTKEMLLAGEPEPPGVTCYAKTKFRLGGE